MSRHNFLSSYRAFKRSKSSFFINLIGLSTGMACALLIYLWVNDELNFDKFHKNDRQLFRVMMNTKVSNGIETTWATSCILAENLAEEMPEVEYAVTASPPEKEENLLSFNDQMIKASIVYAGKEFFNAFSYNLILGNEKQVLADENCIVISEEIAMKLFSTTKNIVGKPIELDHKLQFTISGVFKGTPPNSSTQFDCVLPIRIMIKKYPGIDAWGQNYFNTFLILKPDFDLARFNQKLGDVFRKKSNDQSSVLFLQPYSEQYLYGKYEDGIQSGGRIEYVKLFSIIAIFILLIACVNFMNLSTARASGRAKEVGLKKVSGASRKSLFFQFMGESMLMASLSLLVAIMLVAFFLPEFNEITGKQIAFNIDLTIVLSALCITLFTGFISGSYPAIFLSGFSPATIFKGRLNKFFGELWVRQGLVVFQFTLSVILIVSVIVVYKQIEFTQTKNPGYDKDNVIYFTREGTTAENMETYLSEVRKIPGVVNASSVSWNPIGNKGSTDGVGWPGKNPDDRNSFYLLYVNYDLIETLGIKMKEGRTFSKDFGSDQSKILFNETAIKTMGLKYPIGEVISLWGSNKEIIGVTKDFHFESLHEEVKPLFFLLYAQNNSQIMVKIQSGTEKETIHKLQEFYQKFNPGFPFDFRFLNDDFQAQYVAEKRVAKLSKYFSGLAVLISCLGLFGLSTYTAERRIKEIGIRKINGASVFSIIYLLSLDFAKMVVVSIIIALPISYFITKHWLGSFAYKTPLNWWIFLLAGFAALAIALITVSGQSWRAATRNPVEALRYE